MQNTQTLPIKKILVIVGAIIAFLVVYIVALQAVSAGKYDIQVLSLPSDAIIEVEGQSVKSGESLKLVNGEYSYKATRDGFDETTGRFFVADKSDRVFIAMNPNSEAGEQWLEDNDEYVHSYEELVGSTMNEEGAEQEAAYPILDELPIITDEYTIGYIADPSDPTGKAVIVTINADDGYRQVALDRLRETGYPLGDYVFHFYNHEDPFAS